MKVSFYFALRELRRRPRRVISMLLVSAAILTALNMLLFYLEADWRARVMPDHENNYHFVIKDHTDADRRHIVTQPWVQAWYEIDVENRYGEYEYTELRIRVDWDNVLYSNALAWQMFDELDLWHSEYYNDLFTRMETETRERMTKSWKWEKERVGMSFDEWLEQNTEQAFLRFYVQNKHFCRLTINNYIIRPEFAMYMGLFSCFLGSTMAILFSEQYRANLAEYGTMRAYGIKKRQIYSINCIETALINLVAVPVSWLITAIVVGVYSAATRSLDDGTAYLNLGSYLPLGAMAIVAVMMISVAILGCIGVCFLYRNYTVIELLRGIESHRISFVSKTSPRFEAAESLSVYDRLYITRTRSSFLLNSLILALMLPLPLMYLTMCTGMIGMKLSGGDLLVALYHILQAVLLFATSITVTFVATRQAADGRQREFAILRALGAPKRCIARSAYSTAVLQMILTTLLAAMLYTRMSDGSQHISSMPDRGPINIFALVLQIILYALGALLLTCPPTLGGTAVSQRRFFGRSTMVNLREVE